VETPPRPEDAGASSAAEFPATREKCSEFPAFRPILEKPSQNAQRFEAVPEIPYAAEQGDLFAEQGIKAPCSAEIRDIPRLISAPSARKRGRPKRWGATTSLTCPPSLTATQPMAASTTSTAILSSTPRPTGLM
jgi:hypothetical protein